MESTKPQNQNIELQGEVLFRRKMGKNLCFLTISTTNELTDQIECVLKIPEIIKQITIGDIIQANGIIVIHKGAQKLEITNLKFIQKSVVSGEVNKKRHIFVEKKMLKTDVKSLCRFFKKGLKCPNENCTFRHEIMNQEEEKKLQYLKEEQEKAYHLVHEGDPLSKDDKNKKSYRNTEFADFLVNTFGLENLKKGKILDIAGGKGLTSYNLTTKYGLNCMIIDPRGVTLPKKFSKQLEKKNLTIQENRTMFSFDSCKEFIKNCSLIIGMHPDEATVEIVNTALHYKLNFAVVPCCVFHSKFPERKLKSGKSVVEYNDIINYILEKDNNIQIDFLNIEGRNKVLFKKAIKDE